MSDILVSLLVVLVVGVGVILIFVFTGRKRKQRESAMIQLADQRGWVYEKIQGANRNGYRLSGSDWTFESLSLSNSNTANSGSSEVSFSNRWTSTRAVSPRGLVLIGPKLPSIALGNAGNMLLQKALHLMLGEDAAEGAGLAEVDAGRISLRERYSVWAANTEAAREVLTPELENALLNWNLKELPLLKFSSRGVEISTRQSRMDTPDFVQAMVTLGNAIIGN